MASKIEWTDATWNLFTGCTHKSDGCDHCYAARIASGRLKNHRNYKGLTLNGEWTGEVRFNHHELDKPRHWKKPRMIFVNSMSDTFHDAVKTWWIDELMGVIDDCPQHTFQILTKRSDNIIGKLDTWNGKLPENVWLGVTAENREQINKRVPVLLRIQAAVRFISVEPMLGPVEFYPGSYYDKESPDEDSPCGFQDCPCGKHWINLFEDLPLCALDQVICGGETGPHARPMHPSWARDLRDRCNDVGVPFFFKQWGDWAPFGGGSDYGKIVMLDGTTHDFISFDKDHPRALQGGVVMHKLGKKRAGRLLDGREWNGIPSKVEGPKSKVT